MCDGVIVVIDVAVVVVILVCLVIRHISNCCRCH